MKRETPIILMGVTHLFKPLVWFLAEQGRRFFFPSLEAWKSH